MNEVTCGPAGLIEPSFCAANSSQMGVYMCICFRVIEVRPEEVGISSEWFTASNGHETHVCLSEMG
jgi:hypothetical protein